MNTEPSKSTDSRLESSEGDARFKVVMELSSDWYWEQDENLRFIRLEGKDFREVGLDREKHIGRTWWDTPAMNLTDEDWAKYRAVLDARLPFQDFQLQRDNGDRGIRWHSVSGIPIFHEDGRFEGYRGVRRDITAEKASVEALQLLATSVARISDGVMITESDLSIVNGQKIVFVNDALEKMTGYSAAEMLGRTPRMLQGPGTDRVELRRVRAALELGQSVESELLNYSKTGHPHWIKMEISPVTNSDGVITHFVAVERDVTAKKAEDAKRISLEAQLRESQKMEAIGTLAGGIAHDFNNIVGSILGNAELAIQDSARNPLALESLDEIRKAGVRARELVQQILTFGRRQPTVLQAVNIGVSVRDAIRMLRSTVSTRIEIEQQIFDENATVFADAGQIQQVLINLITNAVHAISGRGGVICVSVETVEHVLNNRSHASPIESAKCVRVEVSDNGKGMDPSTLDRIFEPFFTTKPRGEGTGIGLSVVHGIVHSFGGDIEVSSKLGVGTTFTLHFPQTGESTPLPEEDDEDASKSVPGGLGQRILYVDDDESIVFLMTRMLRRNGYHVLGFDTCEHALAALNADPMGFALLVTDFNMPGMSGLELAVEARKIAQSMPIALASGFVTDEMRIQANEVGIQEVIFKASLVEDFCAAVERILAS